MDKIKVAVIGCNTIANLSHIPAYMANNDCEIKYFCDIVPGRAEEMVAKYGVGKAVENYRDILDDRELDAVSVCTTNNVHKLISVDFLNAGKNVLCEKPAARNYPEVLEMQDACKKSGKILNIGVMNRFNTGVNRIKKMIGEGELGEVYHVYCSFRSSRSIPGLGGGFTTKDIAGGGVLLDWGVHFLDIIMYCVGDPPPRTVSGQAYCKLGKDIKNYTFLDMWAGPPNYNGVCNVEDFITGMIRTEGPTITINGAWAQNIFVEESYIDFIGDKAGVRLNYGADFTVYTTKDGAMFKTTPQFSSANAFYNIIDEFLRSIRSGEKNPSHIDNVMATARIMQALYDSSEKRQEIVL